VIRTVIVDDDRGMRLVARMLAEEEGCLVVGECETGEDAIRLVSRLEPDLVILDYRLPDIDGVETARRMLRAHPGAAIIGWTSTEDPAVAQHFMDAGACAHAIKGDFEAFRAALRYVQAPAA
jgi:DNA-binding NarL/FixJ family response regulator